MIFKIETNEQLNKLYDRLISQGYQPVYPDFRCNIVFEKNKTYALCVNEKTKEVRITIIVGNGVNNINFDHVDTYLARSNSTTFEEASKPLIDWLNSNTNSDGRVIVDHEGATLVVDIMRTVIYKDK